MTHSHPVNYSCVIRHLAKNAQIYSTVTVTDYFKLGFSIYIGEGVITG